MPSSHKNPRTKKCFFLLESVCQYLYKNNKSEFESLNAIRIEGIRIVLGAVYNYFARKENIKTAKISHLFPDHAEDIGPVVAEIFDSNSEFEFDGKEPIGPGFPGLLYGEFLGYGLKKRKNGELYLEINRSRRKSGTFYTPESVTRFMVKETLVPLVKNRSLQKNFSCRSS